MRSRVCRLQGRAVRRAHDRTVAGWFRRDGRGTHRRTGRHLRDRGGTVTVLLDIPSDRPRDGSPDPAPGDTDAWHSCRMELPASVTFTPLATAVVAVLVRITGVEA